MLFNFKKRKLEKEETSRSEVFSRIAEAKRNGRTDVHIDARISMELYNELSLMGHSVYINPRFSSTHIYWKNF